MGSQTYMCHREDFDAGWDAGVKYTRAVEHAERYQMTLLIRQQESLIEAYESMLRRWEQSSAASEATDLADETLELLEGAHA
jgi:hypothetical protein